jgi:hypothetical protein
VLNPPHPIARHPLAPDSAFSFIGRVHRGAHAPEACVRMSHQECAVMSSEEIFVLVMVVGFLAVVYFGNRHSKKNPGDGSGMP